MVCFAYSNYVLKDVWTKRYENFKVSKPTFSNFLECTMNVNCLKDSGFKGENIYLCSSIHWGVYLKAQCENRSVWHINNNFWWNRKVLYSKNWELYISSSKSVVRVKACLFLLSSLKRWKWTFSATACKNFYNDFRAVLNIKSVITGPNANALRVAMFITNTFPFCFALWVRKEITNFDAVL